MNYTSEMKQKVKAIRIIIQTEFDKRMEAALFSYMFDKGLDFLKTLTDGRIENEIKEDQGIFSRDFLVAMIKTARKLATEFTSTELLTYVRMELWMAPNIQEIDAHRMDNGNYEIEDNVNFDPDENGVAVLYVVAEEIE